MGDCLEILPQIEDKSIDMILCDLPYGTTARNKWDCIIPFEPLWQEYNRIIKDNGVICLFSQQPFSADLINANKKYFRYEWIWEKTNATGHLNAHKMPLKCHENILVFYKKLPKYNPQYWYGKPYSCMTDTASLNYGIQKKRPPTVSADGRRYPRDIIKFNNEKGLHPTQKPVKLCEYLIKTYTDEGEIVLDSCLGSGTTAAACINTNRKYIGIEKDEKFFNISKERIEKTILEKESLALQDSESTVNLL